MQVARCPVLEWNMDRTDRVQDLKRKPIFFSCSHSLLSFFFASLADNYVYRNVHTLILYMLLCNPQDVNLRTIAFGSTDIVTHE